MQPQLQALRWMREWESQVGLAGTDVEGIWHDHPSTLWRGLLARRTSRRSGHNHGRLLNKERRRIRRYDWQRTMWTTPALIRGAVSLLPYWVYGGDGDILFPLAHQEDPPYCDVGCLH